jgi:hypothetical protein
LPLWALMRLLWGTTTPRSRGSEGRGWPWRSLSWPRTLQLKGVAEGIESEAQMVWLREMGYRYGLGFRLARQLPAGMVAS